MEKTKSNFYDTFKLGVEIEMETPDANYKKLCDTDPEETNMLLLNDCSLRSTEETAKLCELVCFQPIATQEEEDNFFKAMKDTLGTFKSNSGKDIFAYKNESCSTHIHFSFKNREDKFLWLFDSKDFEWFFFKEYLNKFTSDKFMQRLNNEYCKNPNIQNMPNKEKETIMKKIRNVTIKDIDDEKRNVEGKYRWINTETIEGGTGLEIRIFPHIQSYGGMNQLIEWFKETLVKYIERRNVQTRLTLLEYYYAKCANKTFPKLKLNDYKQLVWQALDLDSKRKNQWSGDIRLLMAKWAKEQPALIGKETNQEII